ncbi:phage tail protein [Oceanimonas smirnovii]|uniref:phage tail-collar fiber domain-containing protein n=1 Tax=Oceanimonas smirnovii TaxID=264574 RepID=UPI003AAB868C
MSQTAITLAFEQHLAELQLGGQPVVPDEFVLAYLPGLDLNTPIDRAAGLPPAGQIVHRQPVDQRGKVNANGVAYSIIMDTRVGDFTFNAMYLVHKASGMVAMVVHKVDEDKLANQGHNQPGNSLVKSMLMEYQGAAEATNTHVDAGTWQIDFTARLMGLDADIRLQALDHYGKIAFIDSGFAVTPGQGVNEFLVAPGLGYIAGLRTELSSVQSVTVSQRPAVLYADVYHAGTLLSDWHTHVEIKASSTPLTDYTDEAGYPHYVVPLASLAANGTVSDLRGRGGLWWHEHRPDAHTKDQVGLSKLENWSWSHSYTDATGGASKYASGKAVADAYNALNSAKLDKTGTAANAAKLNGQLASYYLEWNNLTGKPATFPPSSHAHSWNSITGKPATFPPSGHNHDERYLGKTAKAADSARLNGAIDSENSTGSTIVKRSSSGDINARLFRSEYDTTNASVNFIMTQVDTAGNNYIRPTTPEQFRAGVTDSYYLGKTAKADDSDKLDGQHGSYYRAWGNITGKPATFPPSGHTHDDRYYTKSQSDGCYLGKTAKAADSDKLDGQHSSYYRNAGNMNAGTMPGARMPMTAGALGTYIMARIDPDINSTPYALGDTISGSLLHASNGYGQHTGPTLSGTWQLMGNAPNSGTASVRSSVWLRIL